MLTGKWWALKAAVFCAALSYLCQAPALEVKRTFFEKVVAQGEHPLMPMIVDEGSHEAKLAFRLVPPLLLRVSGLSVEGYYVVQALMGVATLAGLAWLFHRNGFPRRTALLLLVALSFTYVGAVWFLDTQPYFDAIAASALVAAMCVSHPAVVFLGGSIAMWTDERALLSLGVVALFHLHRRTPVAAWAVGAAVAAYAVGRLVLGARYGLSTGQADIGPRVLFDYWSGMPLPLVLALEGLWVALIASYWRALRRAQWLVVAAGALTAASLGVSIMVNDVTRSTVYALPGVVFALLQLLDEPEDRRRRILRAVVALCVVVPTTAAVIVSGSPFDHVTVMWPLPVRLFS